MLETHAVSIQTSDFVNQLLDSEIARDLLDFLVEEPVKQSVEGSAEHKAQRHEDTVQPGGAGEHVVH